MAGRLDGEVALITGAARGQGEAEARMFAREGAQVVVADIRDELGQKVAGEIGPQAIYVRLDVSQETDWKNVVGATVRAFNKLTILVNNAGIGLPEDRGIEQTSLEVWHKTLAVNLTGVFLGMKYAIPEMRKAGHGSIVNISSIAGIVGGGALSAYHPGGVDTEILSPFGMEWKQAVTRAHPMGRIASSDEIAYGVLYLASKESSFVTGAELVIDGGFIAQ